jgi:hypothetical protein
MIFKWFYRKYKNRIYDEIVSEFIGQIPDDIKEPALEFLADRRVLFEKFLSIQAYYIQRARIQSKQKPEFYDGALMIVRAFLAAVNKKVQDRNVVIPVEDKNKETEEQLAGVSSFLKSAKEKLSQ